MRLVDVPMPAAVARRPRDERGYPVLAITPWQDGIPRFAATGTARTYVCAAERRCSVCALPMAPGPVWRVVGGDEADAIARAREEGYPFVNRAATTEAPGHRACMLYAAVVCPYLSRPTARRGVDIAAAGLTAGRGARRGVGGAVAGFDEFEYRLVDGVVLFRFTGLSEFRPHELGEDQIDELAAVVAAECAAADDDHPDQAMVDGPGYLLVDEEAAERRFAVHLAAAG